MQPPSARYRILLLDPAPSGLGWLAEALACKGHLIASVAAAEELVAQLSDPGAASLLVMRLAGPSRAGLDLLRRIRRASPVPCILVAGRADVLAERVAALELGADDCWHHGMAKVEMLARVQAMLRRVPPVTGGTTPVDLPQAHPRAGIRDGAARTALPGGWRLLPQRRVLVAADGRLSIRLTGAEFEFLRLLAAAGGEPVDRDVISRAVFRRPWRIEDRAVDGLVKRLRRKLEDDAIATVRGVGYALLADALPEEAVPSGRVRGGIPDGSRAAQP